MADTSASVSVQCHEEAVQILQKLRSDLDFRGHTKISLSLIGFSSPHILNSFVCMIKKYLKPKLCLVNQKENNYYECIVMFNSKYVHKNDNVDKLTEAFDKITTVMNFSANVIDLDLYMGPVMMAAITRVLHKNKNIQSWYTAKSRMVRMDYWHARSLQEQAEQHARVRVHTSMEFTPSNMINLYFQMNNIRIERDEFLSRLQIVSNHAQRLNAIFDTSIGGPHPHVRSNIRPILHLTDAENIQYTSVNELLPTNNQSTAAVDLRSEVIDLTS